MRSPADESAETIEPEMEVEGPRLRGSVAVLG